MLKQVINPLHVTVMGVHTCGHVHIVTLMACNSCRGLLYKVYNARDITVTYHVHQSFTRSRGTGVNGPEEKRKKKEFASEGERDKNKDARALKADKL